MTMAVGNENGDNITSHEQGNDTQEEPTCLGALSLLPLEMWEEILERLEETMDIRNFCKAWKYPNWDVILHRTKPSWLFSEAFPHIFKYLSTKEQVLICRLVCKRWCIAVDHFLENNPCRRPPYPHEDPNDIRLGTLAKSLRQKGLLNTIFSPGKMEKLQDNHTKETIRNPIIGRSAYFSWSEDTSSTVLPFLSKVGHHIWDFRIEIHEDTPVQFFQTLQKYLEHLPNLRRLEIFGETTLVIEQTVESNLQALKKYNLNMPQLPYLETLEAAVFNQYRTQIMEIFLTKYADNLRRLNLNCYKIPPELVMKLANLTELTWSLDSESQLEPFRSFRLPHLRRLTIYILRNSQRGNYPDFSSIFQSIGACFSGTLRALSIEFPVAYTPIQWSQQRCLPTLNLPHLRTLELKDAILHSFNFICQLKRLEHLHLYHYRFSHPVGMAQHYEEEGGAMASQEEILDLKQLLYDSVQNSPRSDRVYGSNLWKVLPRLQMFTMSKSGNFRTAQNVEQYYRRRQQQQLL